MGTTIATTIDIQKTLFDQAESVAQQFKISRNQLFELAVEHFIKHHQNQALPAEIEQVAVAPLAPTQAASAVHAHLPSAPQTGSGHREIKQGDLYWLQVTEPGYPHPHVVIQDDLLNRSRLNTVVVCALTSNLKRATEPGNILLEVGEANLTRQSVIVVSQLDTVDRTQLGDYIGSLSQQRITQIWAGLRFQQVSFFARAQAR